MDISDFYDTFFEEAAELLLDMERLLLELDVDTPDTEQLNAIFRAAHSIKGGAGAFGFEVLQKTTHHFENLLDHTRKGELSLRRDIVDLFLETKDMLNDQLDAYRHGDEPDPEAFERICKTLQQLALEEIGKGAQVTPDDASVAALLVEPAPVAEKPAGAGQANRRVILRGVSEDNRRLLVEELGQLGEVRSQEGDEARYQVWLDTTASAEDIEAVMCFIIEPEQIEVTDVSIPPGETAGNAAGMQRALAAPTDSGSEETASTAAGGRPAASSGKKEASPNATTAARTGGESTSIRVAVDKVDQIINLVGELIITQSMLDQTASELDASRHGALFNGMNLLQRNARDLQEAVMSIRMVPMDFVFSRFPRVVRETSARLGKEVELVTEGEATELDKSLTERIIDPLMHLVRNSLDHGIEPPEAREAVGKPRAGRLCLSASHQGGSILIEVSDDGAGLNRDRLLAKARENGLAVSDILGDDDVWQLIFAPGFSTAREVTDVSGRGVGMDVVKRNIQGMGGHVDIMSTPGEGTTIRIVLPLTLAILDGMSIKVGSEVFILPLSTVLESLQPAKSDLYAMAGDDVVLKVRDEYLPVVAVHEALDVPDAHTELTDTIAVIVQGEGRRYALLVDDLVGQQQVVVKNLETNYRKVPGVSAATILGDGSVALILDIAGLHRLNRDKKTARHTTRSSAPEAILDRKEVETP